MNLGFKTQPEKLKMGREYYSRADAIMRLNETICLYRGRPYHISILGGGNDTTVTCSPLGTGSKGKSFNVQYTDEDFDYNAFPLGYINICGEAYYLNRMPERRQAQGLSCHSIWAEPRIPDVIEDRRISWFTSQEMEDCILGKYPSVSQAIAAVKSGEASSVAFDRRFKIGLMSRSCMGVYFRNRLLGVEGQYHGEGFSLLLGKDTSFFLKNLLAKGVPIHGH